MSIGIEWGQSGAGWVPQACTLPTVERPLRVAEFDDLSATSVRKVKRRDRTTLPVEPDNTRRPPHGRRI